MTVVKLNKKSKILVLINILSICYPSGCRHSKGHHMTIEYFNIRELASNIPQLVKLSYLFVSFSPKKKVIYLYQSIPSIQSVYS